jgi:hypothetical protein
MQDEDNSPNNDRDMGTASGKPHGSGRMTRVAPHLTGCVTCANSASLGVVMRPYGLSASRIANSPQIRELLL